MRIRYVAMEVVMKSAFLKSVRIVISRTSLQERVRAAVFYELMEGISVVFHHEQPQADVRSARYSQRGKEEAEYSWQARRRKSSWGSRIRSTQGMSASL